MSSYSSLLPLPSIFTPLPSTTTKSISHQPSPFKTRTHAFRVSCNNNDHDHIILPESQKLILPNVDRRNLLVGVGGLCTAANLTSLGGGALAVPIKTPEDITKPCKEVTGGFSDADGALRDKACCLPDLGKTVQPFVLPTENTMRKRWPAHKGTEEQVADYIAAIKAMRELDVKEPNNPHSFKNQAKIHCAYCHGSYKQNDREIQVHDSWLFFPFHRWYLYFYERILGKLIGKPDTFALPYWQWDDPAGMRVPDMFLTEEALSKDVYRDAVNMRRGLVDLNFRGKVKKLSDEEQIACNLGTVYRDLIRNGATTEHFFGGKYVAGNTPDENEAKNRVTSSVESGSHTAVHRWVGDHTKSNNEDMGIFYSAGYDPLFYAHHANVDRMWKLWKDLGKEYSGHDEPDDEDWLNASYVFYDENLNLVRVTNKDCVDLDKLHYNYVEEESKELAPWRTKGRPARRNSSSQVTSTVDEGVPTEDQLTFPMSLNKIQRVRVKRPAVNNDGKKEANEILCVNDIHFDSEKFVKFDVFINDQGKTRTLCDPEYAGGFAHIPHGNMDEGMSMMSTGAARFGLTEILEDTDPERKEYATVTFVPREGCEDLTIGQIEIKLVPIKA